MNAQQFIAGIEGYFGAYDPPARKLHAKKWAEENTWVDLDILLDVLKDVISTQFKGMPNVPEFNDCMEEYRYRLEQKNLKLTAIQAQQEKRLLLAGNQDELVLLNGELVQPMAYLFHLVDVAYQEGRNPVDDPAIIEFKKKYVIE